MLEPSHMFIQVALLPKVSHRLTPCPSPAGAGAFLVLDEVEAFGEDMARMFGEDMARMQVAAEEWQRCCCEMAMNV